MYMKGRIMWLLLKERLSEDVTPLEISIGVLSLLVFMIYLTC